MRCELCFDVATEKHHITYFPEQTIPVCSFHGDEIHLKPSKYSSFLKYKKSDSAYFYSQQSRIGRFLEYLSNLQNSNTNRFKRKKQKKQRVFS
jgi:hypothetical protein